MRFASLGSGSRGNALLVEAGNTLLLIDAEFGPREMSRRLERLGLAVEDIDAVLVTHEHSDHIGGAFACARRFGWPVLLTHGTFAASRDDRVDVNVTIVDSHESFPIGDIGVRHRDPGRRIRLARSLNCILGKQKEKSQPGGWLFLPEGG